MFHCDTLSKEVVLFWNIRRGRFLRLPNPNALPAIDKSSDRRFPRTIGTTWKWVPSVDQCRNPMVRHIMKPHQIGSILAAAALLSTGCSGNLVFDGLSEPVPAVKTVHANGGGEIVEFALNARRHEQYRALVRFAGPCFSACTLYLTLPTVLTCIVPGASFGFHLPVAGTREQSEIAEAFMFRDYPSWVRNWIESNGGLTSDLKIMPYEYAAVHIPPCEGNP